MKAVRARARNDSDVFLLLQKFPSLGPELQRLAQGKRPSAGPPTSPAEQGVLPIELPVMSRRTWRRKLQDEAERRPG